ncbi:peptide chain release factor-like protein [Candidatus Sumerlaeota bacterium]|nr:peptide chain release factor-like protein [Candidatus Sumerlaeota bacterium]
MERKMPDNYAIPPSDDDLLSECEIETYCSTGPGGQNVNKRETAVRLRHLPSGIVVTCQEERAQYRNKRIALENLRLKLKKWIKKPRKRIPTTLPVDVKEKILENKKRKSRKKQERKKPVIE